MKVELVFITPEAERLIARCARMSRRRFEAGTDLEEDRALIRKLIELGHESVLEHAVATFKIEGISRICANQLTRHRLASFVQESMRYVNVEDHGFVIPKSFPEGHNRAAKELFYKALRLYSSLIAVGVPKEDARFLLPLGISTELVMTANFRELRHILKLRLAPDAQWEIREVARKMLELLYKHAPSCFEDIKAWFGG